ncbi:MAG: GNAT family N-acetyltransferase [Candidatus Marinimicrobia bacterium]|nr:GNAT family N-acetyltransferase [Candidatus Neomarinimicrobiota bacterium]MBL7110236.1 GNAT family N-acetyltransferase [Candidatus Neomarinimicrobiota bacterium]
MNKSLVIRKVENEEELMEVFKIRKQVFCDEQRVSEEIEYDEFESIADHFIVFQNKIPIGCARCRNLNNAIKLERIALLIPYRKRGYGKFIVKYLIKFAQQQNPNSVYLHAQTYLIRFYEKLDFIAIGEEFKEDGLPHIKMVKQANV